MLDRDQEIVDNIQRVTRGDYAAGMADLAITAAYTAQVWAWGGFPCAELCVSADSKRVFDATNAVLGVMRRGTPLRYGLVHRHAMIDHLLQVQRPQRIVELAAGFSQRGAAMSADSDLDYVEVDLPEVVAHKRALLERTDAGRAVLARPNYRLVADDVATYQLPPADVVVAEGLMMYLGAAARHQLFTKAAGGAIGRLVFDLTLTNDEPAPGITGRLLDTAMKRFTNGRSFERDVRTRADMSAELRTAGFGRVDVIGAAEVARDWNLPHPDRRTPTVIFTADRDL